MTRSMTAYARAASEELGGLSWEVEIHSVNRKGLDIHLNLGREFLFLDVDLRKMIAEEIHRGQITVKVNSTKNKQTPYALPVLKKLKSHFEKMARSLGLSTEEIDLKFLIEQLEHTSLEEKVSPQVHSLLKKTVLAALHSFIKMKEVEGKALKNDIVKRLKILINICQRIEKISKNAPDQYRKKLVLRLEQLLEGVTKDERILREVAIFAEKADVTEEIVRLKSHIGQMETLFKAKEKSIGRTLDFITQEALREINTIASKSPALEITKEAIAAKGELEKIREQVQNIE